MNLLLQNTSPHLRCKTSGWENYCKINRVVRDTLQRAWSLARARLSVTCWMNTSADYDYLRTDWLLSCPHLNYMINFHYAAAGLTLTNDISIPPTWCECDCVVSWYRRLESPTPLLPALLVAAPLSRRNYAPEFSSPELRHFTQHRKLQRVAANAL